MLEIPPEHFLSEAVPLRSVLPRACNRLTLETLSINLSRSGSGERLTKFDLFGQHVRRQLLSAMPLQLRRSQRIAVINSHNCMDAVANCLVWNRQSHRLVDSRM